MVRNQVAHQGDIIYRIEQLERKLNERTSGRKLTSSSIGNGGLRIIDGGFLEVDGGEMRLLAGNGVPVVRFGDVHFGEWSRGWEFNFPSGQRAFTLGGNPESPTWALWDRHGRYIVTNDSVTGHGLARPYLNYQMVPSRESEVVDNGPFWPSVEGGSYTELFYGYNPIQHPRISFGIQTAAVSGDTEWRLLIDGTEITSGSGGAGGIYDIPGWGTDIQPVSMHRLSLEVRQSDSTRAWAQITRCYGHQS